MRPSRPRAPRLLRGYRPLRPGPDSLDQRADRARVRSRMVALVLACLTLMTLDHHPGTGSPLEPAREAMGAVLGPVESGTSVVVRPVTAVGSWFTTRRHLEHDVAALQAENTRLEARQATSQYQRNQLAEFQGLTSAAGTLGQTLVPAHVVAYGPAQSFSRTVTIDAGTSSGVRKDMTVLANYNAVAAKLDIDDFIEYMIVNDYAGNSDWATHNWYASFNRVDPAGRWHFHSWDAEFTFRPTSGVNEVNVDVTTKNESGSPTEIQTRLAANPEYRLRFADHVQRLMANGGVLTPSGAAAVYLGRVQQVDRAMVGESARWGDNHDEPAHTRNEWRATQDGLLANYFPNRTGVVIGQFQARGWLASLVRTRALTTTRSGSAVARDAAAGACAEAPGTR